MSTASGPSPWRAHVTGLITLISSIASKQATTLLDSPPLLTPMVHVLQLLHNFRIIAPELDLIFSGPRPPRQLDVVKLRGKVRSIYRNVLILAKSLEVDALPEKIEFVAGTQESRLRFSRATDWHAAYWETYNTRKQSYPV